ncbi:EamA family transporter [Cronbergia sp. UHCC 0137]|uniref:EamA family transporter n=1 Tax=Cronbergia sp. UHCC 0137 TaxID=3110239 RepID=UPI002B21AE52|nr:EamA family transporter [Cronbergia sp. UHCC 0137]MEA5616575.1 EamA family transporter [Cronbergia sp. UHCC 0137]
MVNHLYILLTILFTVYGQIVIKWQVNSTGNLPTEVMNKIGFILNLLLNPWIISGLASAFLASLSWMAAMSKFPLSYAYPFMSLSFVLVVFLSSVFFREPITIPKTMGMALIIAGIIIGSRG